MKIRSLRHILAIRSVWIAVVPFVLSAILGWFWLRPQMIADTEEHQRQLAEVIASRTEDYLLASSRTINRTASVFSKKLVRADELHKYLGTVLALRMSLTSLTFTDSSDRITAIAFPPEKASLQQEMLGIDLSLTSAVRQVRASGKPAWSNAYLSPVSGGLAVAYATPAGEGVALGEISLTQLSSFLRGIAGHGKLSIFILDRRGQVIADQEGRYTARQFNLTNLEIVREGLAGDKPMTRRFTFNGTKVVGCMIKAPLLDWNILVASPVDAAYRSALTTTGIFATALCMALLLAYGLALFMSQSLARRFEKLVSHARRIESGENACEWPKAPVKEFNLLGDALQSMANTLREREARLDAQVHFFQQLLDSIPIPVYYKDRDGLYLGCNAAFEAFIGKSRGEITGKTVFEVVPKERAEKHHEADSALFSEPGIQIYEAPDIYHDGQFHDLIFNKATFVDADNQVAGVVGALIDITPLRKAEEKLRESEEKFRVLAETSPSAIILHQGEKFIYTNPATTKISGYSETELLEMNFWEWGGNEHGDSLRRRGLGRLAGKPESPQYEHKLITKLGEEKWVLVSAGVTEYRGKSTAIATLLDITEAKMAEERTKVALAEKEVLLKEVHHRVKNNMQIISSLLDLQSDYLPDKSSRTCIRESQNRIRSMALIHERLYQSKNFSSIDVGEYIRDLSHYLFGSYAVDYDQISLRIDAGNISMDINRTVPCGLIINELISNSLKHAFPKGRKGEISVRVSSEGGIITLEVADTGVGLPHDLDLNNSETLGLQLVTMLVQQLNGRISFETGQTGAVFVISFSEK
ncbi:MAG TPA: PAS domain S-box protein [Geobacteraceae bacterium]|nr:PAS domain S-box protein [Geobacteraceae bacterium]